MNPDQPSRSSHSNLPIHDAKAGFFELLRARHSVRAFEAQPVEEEQLKKILAASNGAPSAGNLQAYEIVVVRDEPRRIALAHACCNQMFIAEAPVVLIFCANPVRSQAKYGLAQADLFSLQDATIACAYAELATAAVGLGTVWIGALDVPLVRKITEMDTEWKPIALLPIGYRRQNPASTPRRHLTELVHELS